MSSETDEGYVHRPGAVDDAVDSDAEESADAAEADSEAAPDSDARAPLPGPEPTGFGNRGWVLVATVVLCFLVIPGVIYLRPALPGEAGLSFIVAMLILPLVPALLLGVTAVWSMAASRRR